VPSFCGSGFSRDDLMTAQRLFGVLSVLLALLTTAAAADRPNLLLILTDNQSPSLLGAYGNTEIKTPSIDRLAKQGMLFTRAFATSGVCSPARAVLLTGLIPSRTGVHNGLPDKFSVPDYSAIEEFRNLPQTLADAGYATALVGKYHLGAHEKPQLGFGVWATFPGGHTESFVDQVVVDDGRSFNVMAGGEHMTDFWTRRAVDFIRAQSKKRPFFLMLSYNGPYVLPPTVLDPPNTRHAAWYEAHPPKPVGDPVHPYLEAFAKTFPDNIPLRGGNVGKAAIESLTNPRAMVNVASEVTMVDDGVGKVLATLDKSGLAKNTLVVFMSDQGSAYGQHGLWGNSSWGAPYPAYNANMQIPLIVRHPGRVKAGSRSDHTINEFDLLPTLLDYLGLGDRAIAHSPGVSHAALLRGGAPGAEQPVFWEYITTRVIQTRQWKLVKRFLDTPDELYDLASDPGENRNLAIDPAHAAVMADLSAQLNAFFERYADPQWDVWRGGTAKATLVYGGRNKRFAEHFPDWTPPVTRKSVAFRDPPPL
jgi:arylsulfatase A-like enzyme